jgi:ABC-type xylose transport system permease subunit
MRAHQARHLAVSGQEVERVDALVFILVTVMVLEAGLVSARHYSMLTSP